VAKVNGKQERSWTVLVYLIADDPQGGELFDQVAHRELDNIVYGTIAADKNDRLNVAVQVDFRNQPYVWRRIIREGTWEQPESNAADPATLYGFFEWAARKCPAENYALILWGHSAGPFGLFTDEDVRTYVAQTLTMNELRDALQAAATVIRKPVDIVAFKDCCMSTIETARELQDVATYLLASQNLVPAEGWPYEALFTALLRGNTVDDSARGAANALTDYYAIPKNRGDNDEVPYSLLDLRRSGDVVLPLKSLVHWIVGDVSQTKVHSPLQEALRLAALPDERAMIDVHAFCAALQRYGDGPLTELAGQVDKAAYAMVARSPGGDRFSGLNVFCYPVDPDAQRRSRMASNASDIVYRGLTLSAETQWSAIALAAKPELPDFLKRLQRQAAATRAYNTGQLLPQAAERLRRQGVIERLQIDAVTFISQSLSAINQNSDATGLFTVFDPFSLNRAIANLDKGANLETDKGANLETDKGANLEIGFRLLPDDHVGGKPNGRPPA
jgi:hypothetical protein